VHYQIPSIALLPAPQEQQIFYQAEHVEAIQIACTRLLAAQLVSMAGGHQPF
jgi:hypothetical protein